MRGFFCPLTGRGTHDSSCFSRALLSSGAKCLSEVSLRNHRDGGESGASGDLSVPDSSGGPFAMNVGLWSTEDDVWLSVENGWATTSGLF